MFYLCIISCAREYCNKRSSEFLQSLFLLFILFCILIVFMILLSSLFLSQAVSFSLVLRSLLILLPLTDLLLIPALLQKFLFLVIFLQSQQTLHIRYMDITLLRFQHFFNIFFAVRLRLPS